MRLSFLGAAGTVTGSKLLIEHDDRRVLVDCGLFQGYKQLRLRNWDRFPVPPERVAAVVLTHAHLDHSGYLPALVRDGFAGPVYATAATAALADILLRDSGHLLEEEADYANRHGFSKHHPALPLYTEADAERALDSFRPLGLETALDLGGGLQVRLHPAGHILGAAMVEISAGGITLLCSGDLGRPHDPVMRPPAAISRCDYLVVESTYGDRLHPAGSAEQQLADVINRTAARGGITVIPSFAVERAQTLMYYLYRLKLARRIPDVPVFLNSPMATDVTALFRQFGNEHRLSPADCEGMCRVARIVRSVEESKLLNRRTSPAIIIAASGMATGGRVLHHLKAFAPHPRNTLLFSGFQAGGTRGAAIVAGAESVRIHGEDVPIRAEVVAMEHLSAHADANEIMAWLRGFARPPRHTFVVHGEPNAADTLRRRISVELGWRVSVPEHLASVELS